MPFSVIFLFSVATERLLGEGRVIFSKTELAGVGEAPQCYEIFRLNFVVFSVVAMTTPFRLVRHPAQDKKMGPEFHQLHSLLSIQGNNNNNTDVCKLYATKWQTLPLFWNCVCKSYIFTCRLLLFCVLEICCIGFFVKRWKSKNSVCVEKMCHIENVVRSKSSEIIFVFVFLLFFFNILFISVGDMFEGFEGGIGNHTRYMIFV